MRILRSSARLGLGSLTLLLTAVLCAAPGQKLAPDIRTDSSQGMSGVLNGTHYRLSAKKLAELAGDPEVAYIRPDRRVETLDYASPTVNANLAFDSGTTGTSIGVAVIDSGIKHQLARSAEQHGSSRLSYTSYYDLFTVGAAYLDVLGGAERHECGEEPHQRGLADTQIQCRNRQYDVVNTTNAVWAPARPAQAKAFRP